MVARPIIVGMVDLRRFLLCFPGLATPARGNVVGLPLGSGRFSTQWESIFPIDPGTDLDSISLSYYFPFGRPGPPDSREEGEGGSGQTVGHRDVTSCTF